MQFFEHFTALKSVYWKKNIIFIYGLVHKLKLWLPFENQKCIGNIFMYNIVNYTVYNLTVY